jgi:hypothetical protein
VLSRHPTQTRAKGQQPAYMQGQNYSQVYRQMHSKNET